MIKSITNFLIIFFIFQQLKSQISQIDQNGVKPFCDETLQMHQAIKTALLWILMPHHITLYHTELLYMIHSTPKPHHITHFTTPLIPHHTSLHHITSYTLHHTTVYTTQHWTAHPHNTPHHNLYITHPIANHISHRVGWYQHSLCNTTHHITQHPIIPTQILTHQNITQYTSYCMLHNNISHHSIPFQTTWYTLSH